MRLCKSRGSAAERNRTEAENKCLYNALVRPMGLWNSNENEIYVEVDVQRVYKSLVSL